MRKGIKSEASAAQRLLKTAFINRPIDIGPALERAAVERYWLERQAEADLEEQDK